MSLLLEARKKSQEAATSGGEGRADSGLSLEPLPSAAATPSSVDNARHAGQNLFKAKFPPSSLSRPAINRSLMYAAGGTLVLLAAGGGYVWYAISDSDTQPLQAVSRPVVESVAQVQPIVSPLNDTKSPGVAVVTDEIRLPNLPVEEARLLRNTQTGNVAATRTINKTQKSTAKLSDKPPADKQTSATTTATSSAKPIRIEPQPSVGTPDLLLNRAYAAYRNGQLEDAQRLYLDMLGKDVHNSDALLGLAAIAQQRNEDRAAVQYYSRVLNMDPRNAVANAGMSTLSNNENYESRLKTLLREQGSSAALHFALGNLYAEQSRWGEAQQAYFNAYSLDSKNADLAFNLAVSLDHLGQGKLAAQHYQQSLQLDQSRSANFDRAKISQRIEDLLR